MSVQAASDGSLQGSFSSVDVGSSVVAAPNGAENVRVEDVVARVEDVEGAPRVEDVVEAPRAEDVVVVVPELVLSPKVPGGTSTLV